MKATLSQARELENELKKAVSGEVRFDAFSRVLYSTDASIYQVEPVGVVVPRSVEDVLATIDVARHNGVPILPRGGGTSLAGQTVNHAIVIDFSKYIDGVLEVNPEERWARVQPGIVLDQLNRQLAKHGLKYAPDPSTSNRASVGGGIGNNSCGSHSVIYGKTSENTLGVKVALADGSQAVFGEMSAAEVEARLSGDSLESQIYRGVLDVARRHRDEVQKRYPRISRRVSGYNLDQFVDGGCVNMTDMVVGSEGTLCVITEVTLKLVPRPKMTGLAVVHFDDMAEACASATTILKHGPSAVELIGRMLLDRTRESPGFSRMMTLIEGRPDAVLAVEFYGESPLELKDRLEKFRADMQRQRLGYACVNLTDPAAQANVWNIRKAGVGLLMSLRGDAKPIPFVEDTAVDALRLGEYVRRFDSIVKAHGTTAGYYGHASEGCLHIRPLVNLKTGDGIKTMVAIAEEVGDLVKEFGGAFSGEHGDGIVRGVWTEKMFGPTIYRAFKEVKAVFDPQNIMNPGKIIDCPPMTENLRYGAGYESKVKLTTALDFSADYGFDGAVELCNGMGACRKADGTMCPSYMVTKEEEHSTRGRANLLRAVLSGQLPADTMTSHRLYEALDLCLECKGCKGECPSAVDMAKLKYEFLDKYHEAHGTPLRARLFANIRTLNQWGHRLGPLANIAPKLPGARWLLHSMAGIHKNRALPRLSPTTFSAWHKKHTPLGDGARGTVVLFNDTFMEYNTPSVGIAATELLEKAGFRVVLAERLECCGRPMISKGMLEKAKENARRNVERLLPHVKQGATIVGCEPSCLLTLRDEYPDLLRDEASKEVARATYLIDEFLDRLREQGKLELKFKDTARKVLFHGHCHQKALVGTVASLRLLRLPPKYTVEVVDSGCCGMAGSFGFEKEHYDVSMAIGGQRLFPAVTAKGDDWEVAVMGISCRQQIEHGTGRRPRHLVEVLREAVA
jgi:FAD/FMN-containing dehydrogenase/Fe-S oxidoreductase